MRTYLITSIIILLCVGGTLNAQDIERVQIVSCLNLETDEYPELQTLGGFNNVWANGSWANDMMSVYPKRTLLETVNGWQYIAVYYTPHNTYVLVYDEWWNEHPCGAYSVNRQDLISVLHDD